jgi:hypothetical protein
MNLAGSSTVMLLSGGASRLSNLAGGVINDTSSAETVISGEAGTTFANAGTFNKNTGSAATQTIGAPMTNTGTVNVRTGTLVATAFPANDGTLDVSAGATLSTGGATLTNTATGVIRGDGTIAGPLVNNGTLAPASSPGTLTIDGDYTQGPGGRLAIELGGTEQGVTYDLLKVGGSAALDGTLAVTLLDGFTPADGAAFEVITYASVSGDFAANSSPPGTNWNGVPGATGYTTMPFAPQVTIAEVTRAQIQRIDRLLQQEERRAEARGDDERRESRRERELKREKEELKRQLQECS